MRGIPFLLLFVACNDSSGDPPSSVRVVSISPASDAVDVPLDTPITIELSAAPAADLDIALTASTGESIAHTVAIDGNLVTLTPTDPLWLATGYDLSVATAEPFASKFVTRDGTWKSVPIHTQPMALRAAPLGAGAAPNLAALPDGTVLAGWEGGPSLYDQKFTPGTGWLPMPNKLDITGDPGFVEVRVVSPTRALMMNDRYIVASNIEARTYDGTRWSAPVVVGPYRVGDVRYDQYGGGSAATDQTYALVFHRGEFDVDQFDVYGAIHANGAWSAPFLVEDMVGEASAARIIDDGRGGYVIAWIQRSVDRTSTAVWMRTLSATGALGTPERLEDGVGNTHGLSLARGGDSVWITWAHEQGGSTIKNRITMRPFRASGLGAPHTVDIDGYFGDSFLQLTASAHGALVAYTLYGGVFAAFGTHGGAWGPFVEIEKIPMTPGSEAGRPAITIDDRGNASVVWTRLPATGRRTTVVSRGRAGTWSPAQQLDEGPGSTYAWTAGVDAAGRVTTSWSQSDTDGYIVWAAQLQ